VHTHLHRAITLHVMDLQRPRNQLPRSFPANILLNAVRQILPPQRNPTLIVIKLHWFYVWHRSTTSPHTPLNYVLRPESASLAMTPSVPPLIWLLQNIFNSTHQTTCFGKSHFFRKTFPLMISCQYTMGPTPETRNGRDWLNSFSPRLWDYFASCVSSNPAVFARVILSFFIKTMEFGELGVAVALPRWLL